MTPSRAPRPQPATPATFRFTLPGALTFVGTLFAIGCASPGPPRPPSLNLPQPVTDLTAQRIGNQVVLHWTTPTRSTDGLDLKGSLSAQLCRQSPPPNAPCTPVLTIPAHPGATSATDTLPPALTTDPVQRLTYRVRILNTAGRAAEPSNLAYAAAGATPPSVEPLHATPVKAGVMLEWPPQTDGSTVELDRSDPALVIAQRSSTKSRSTSPLKLAGQEDPEVHLRPKHDATNTDPGGTLDLTVRTGETYVYAAQRIRSLTLAGQHLEIRTSPSPPVTLTIQDTFPPPAPTGLAAIPGSAATKPNAPPQPSIDLSWQPVPEPDLAGYLVYRHSADSAAKPTRLTQTPILTSAFSDLTATPGQRYTYHVTAVDQSGNESPPSEEVQETLPRYPGTP